MCHWIGLHHMLVMFASQSWAQMCTATHLWDCTSAQTMHWSVVKMVFEAGFWTQVTCWIRSWRKDCLWSVKVQLMKNQKGDSEDYLTKSNYLNKTLFIATFWMSYTRIQIHSLTKYIWSTTPCFPIHVWTLWPSPLSISEITILVNISKGTDVVWEIEGATNCTCVLIFFWYLYMYNCIYVVWEREQQIVPVFLFYVLVFVYMYNCVYVVWEREQQIVSCQMIIRRA